MKRYLVILATISIIATAATAQTGPIAKGTVLTNGSLSFFAGNGTTQFGFFPTVGYFFANNLAIGATVNLNSNKLGEASNTTFGIGPFARYYIGQTATKPFVAAEFNFLSNTAKSDNSPDIKSNGTSFLFGLGFAAFVNETIAVEGLSGYNYTDYNTSEGTGGFALRFGFGLYFNRKHVEQVKTNVMGE